MSQSKILKEKCVSDLGGRNLPISVYAPAKNALRHLILIVYGGTVGFRQKRLWSMKKMFALAGYHAASFDFWGNTPGSDFYKSSLQTRVEDLEFVLIELKKRYPDHALTILGVSMGGYVSTFFADYDRLTGMILVAPAAYHPDAMSKRIPFGKAFSELIRAPQSWATSDGFTNIAHLRKPLLLIRFGRDNVVPSEVIEKYHDAATDSRRIILTFPLHKHKGNFRGKKLKRIMPWILWWLNLRENKTG